MNSKDDPQKNTLDDIESTLEKIERSLGLSERIRNIEESLSSIGAEGEAKPSSLILLGLAFGAFGLAVGILVGLTETEITKPLIAALFAVFGGSLVAFLHKLTGPQQIKASVALGVMSLTLLVGTLSGIWLRHNRMLSPADTTESYLRNSALEDCNRVDSDYQNGEMELAEAYREMYSVCVLKECDRVHSMYREGDADLTQAYEGMYSACLGEGP